LAAAGQAGRYAAGVRYTAWKLPRGLHPTIDPHTPLHFVFHDLKRGRALGAFKLDGPGFYDTRPENARVARERLRARFAIESATAMRQAPPLEVNEEFPMTLDLRRAR
jgi:uncharacterized protein (DUF2126 family)